MPVAVWNIKEVFAMNVRIRFSKTGSMKYIGHLDMLRYFQKALRRAKLPVRLTEGYNPHQIMAFALPLGVGITSNGEYMDIELTKEVALSQIVFVLNQTMVPEIQILSAITLPAKSKNAMAAVTRATYLIYYKQLNKNILSVNNLLKNAMDFYQNPEIIITKKTKKSERMIDLKPLIYDFYGACFNADFSLKYPYFDRTSDKFLLTDNDVYFYIELSAGSVDNIKPELFFDALMEHLGYQSTDYNIGCHRLDLFQNIESETVSLGKALI